MTKSLNINFQLGLYITSCKCRLEYLDKKIVDTSQIKKKEKKLFDKEQIVFEIYNWIIQNAITQKQYQIEKLIEKIWALEDIKVYYTKIIVKLNFEKFGAFVLKI